ncbi:MAG: NPCBM/NEW2 domain-containing protein [Armatimonadota bacterium]
MRILIKSSVILLSFLQLWFTSFSVAAPIEVRPFDGVVTKLVNGATWAYSVKEFTIAKQYFTSYGKPNRLFPIGRTCTFNIQGWDHFTAYVGIIDQPNVGKSKVIIYVDEQMVFQQDFEPGDRAVPIDVVLTGHTTINITTEDEGATFAEPKLVKGTPDPFPKVLPVTVIRYTAAPYFIGYADLDSTAKSLRTEVNANPALKERIEKGMLALVPFIRIDIPVPAVGTNTAEDFSTALINAGFNLTERGRLEQALQQLQLPESGLLDPTTTQQLGKQTGCDLLLIGSLSDRGQAVILNLRLVDAVTGKALLACRTEAGKVTLRK